MKACRFQMLALAAMIMSGTCVAAAEFKNGTAFALGNVPKELFVERRADWAGEFGEHVSSATEYALAAEPFICGGRCRAEEFHSRASRVA